VTFSGAQANDMATLKISGNASVSPFLEGIGDTARTYAAAILIPESSSNGVGDYLAGNDFTSVNGNYQLQDTAQNGVPYLLLVVVDAYAGLSGGAEGTFAGGSASIDDQFQLDVPLGVTATFASSVPEPATWAMLIIGIGGIGFMAYRRKSKTA
jgi:hypothetical protein